MEQQAEIMTVRGRPKLPSNQRKVLMTVMVEPEKREEIERLAEKSGQSLGEIHRQALEIGLASLARKDRRS